MGICARLKTGPQDPAQGPYAITLEDGDGVRHTVWSANANGLERFRVALAEGGCVDFFKTAERDEMGLLIFRQGA